MQTTTDTANDAEHIGWIHCICDLAKAPSRAVEFIERGLSRQEIARALWPLVHGGETRPRDDAPWPNLIIDPEGCSCD